MCIRDSPFENPNGWTNLLQVLLLLMIPFSLPWTYGRMVGDRRQGALVTGVMAFLYAASVGLTAWVERAAATGLTNSLEGKEARFGIVPSVVFGAATTGTSTGAVNSMHESYSCLLYTSRCV